MHTNLYVLITCKNFTGLKVITYVMYDFDLDMKTTPRKVFFGPFQH